MKRRKQKRSYSILFIPDEDGISRSIKLSANWLRFITLIGIFITATLIFIAVSYWHVARVAFDYNRLYRDYQKVRKENRQVYQIIHELKRLKHYDAKIRETLSRNPNSKIQQIESFTNNKNDSTLASTYILDEDDYFTLMRSVPSLSPVRGFVTQEFDGKNGHFGMDIVAKEGTLIQASCDGIVLFSGWTYEAGNMLILFHGNDYLTIYQHNQRNLISERTFVKRGEPIAVLGNSGHVTSGSHLHFEVWKNGVAQNPRDYILL